MLQKLSYIFELYATNCSFLMNNALIKILIANDHILLREGLGNAILEKRPDKFLISYVVDFESIINYLDEIEVDLVIIDFIMPNGNAFDTISSIKNKYPETKVILIGMFDKSSIKYFPNLLSQLDGLLSFNCEVEKYLEAVDTVLKNGLYFYL